MDAIADLQQQPDSMFATHFDAAGKPDHWDWSKYQLQVGDGVVLYAGSRQGIIREIVGQNGSSLALVEWLDNGERESIPIHKLEFMPTIEHIYGKKPGDPHTPPNENCKTLEIQREWTEAERRQRTCYPSPAPNYAERINLTPRANGRTVVKKLTNSEMAGAEHT